MSEYVSKVVYGNTTLIDLTDDTVNASTLMSGYTAHGADGSPIVGACTYDADTKDATATVDDILLNKTAYKNGLKITGAMPNVGQQISYLSTRDSGVSINTGYHDGSGSIALGTADRAALVSDNVREGITILGIVGTMKGTEDVKASAISVTPYTSSKVYSPTDFGDYNYFSTVTVNAIAYATTSNPSGGITATIGTVAPA